VTRRAWLLLVVGALLVGAFGGFALANRGESATFTPTASWNMFPPARWQAIRDRAGARGFSPETVRVVAAVTRQDGTPLALLAGQKSGRTCFVLVHGGAMEPAICKLAKPLVLFAFRDRWGGRRVVDVLGLASRRVQSVVQETTLQGKPWRSGVVLSPVPGAFAFGIGTTGTQARFLGSTASGRVLTQVHVAP
jgi:hypothetical protein